MKKMIVLDLSDKLLFEGTRHEVKAFLRANKQVKRYKITDAPFIEKVMMTETSKDDELTLFQKVFGNG